MKDITVMIDKTFHDKSKKHWYILFKYMQMQQRDRKPYFLI